MRSFDLARFKKLNELESGEVQVVLSRLIATEQRHVAFWQEFFGLRAERLNFSRRLKLAFCVCLRRMFGTGITYLILEAIEIYGIKSTFSYGNNIEIRIMQKKYGE